MSLRGNLIEAGDYADDLSMAGIRASFLPTAFGLEISLSVAGVLRANGLVSYEAAESAGTNAILVEIKRLHRSILAAFAEKSYGD